MKPLRKERLSSLLLALAAAGLLPLPRATAGGINTSLARREITRVYVQAYSADSTPTVDSGITVPAGKLYIRDPFARKVFGNQLG